MSSAECYEIADGIKLTLGALILAGGAGERFGGKKALIKLGGEPLLSHVVKRAMEFAREIVVVIGKDDGPGEYRRILPPEVAIARDTVTGWGPLAGILAGMQGMRSEYAAVLPCDSPFASKDALKFLFNRAREADAAIPRWPNGYIEPLHAAYRVSSALPAAEESVGVGKLAIRDMIARLDKVIYVNTDELRKFDPELLTFFNINSQDDLKRAAELLKSLAI